MLLPIVWKCLSESVRAFLEEQTLEELSGSLLGSLFQRDLLGKMRSHHEASPGGIL